MDIQEIRKNFDAFAREFQKEHDCKIEQGDGFFSDLQEIGTIKIGDKGSCSRRVFTMYENFVFNRIEIHCNRRAKNACKSHCMSHVVWIGGYYELERVTSEIIENINVNYL